MHLRANDLFYMTPLEDGERLLHCFNYLELKEEAVSAGEDEKMVMYLICLTLLTVVMVTFLTKS